MSPSTTKLVRHVDPRLDIQEIIAANGLEQYQSYQSKPVFHGCQHVLSFVGEPENRARFFGLFEVVSTKAAKERVPVGASFQPHWVEGAEHWYDLRRVTSLDALRDRLVVQWSGRSWHRWFTQDAVFEVFEIRPPGRALPPIADYAQILLTYTELQTLVASTEAHRDWVSALRNVGGIYLIVSARTGAQYVGSATGEEGIWGRWSSYAGNGLRDNTLLRKLLDEDPTHARDLTFSILDTFSRSLTKAEAIVRESQAKYKLGSRAFGLNAN